MKNMQQGPKWTPRCMFTTQSFDSWLEFFLSRKVIEDSLQATWTRHRTARCSAAFGSEMHDVQDSPAWQRLYDTVPSAHHLIFAIYVDWFNPYTNKIAGKKASSGTIMLYCLNLPPHLRYRPENTFIVGITPSPHAPNPTTISHLLDPIVESLAKYNISFSVPTFGNPAGVPITVKAVPLIADLEANNKVSGFLAHSAIMYCSFCLSTQDQIEDLNLQSFQIRNGQTAVEYTGHTTLTPTIMLPPDSPTPSPATLDTSPSTTPTQGLSPDMDVDDHNDPDFIPPLSLDSPPFDFSEPQLLSIRDCIQHVTLPTWVQRPPTNLGDPSHGKLKAHEYLTLFTAIFPIIIPELWHGPDTSDTDHEHLKCFHHLVSATNIIASFTTSFSRADDYTHNYIAYRALIQQLYPHFSSKPNHHYAMHNGDLMKRWGPLPCISEFFGERVNGMLQGTNTNQRLKICLIWCMIGDMDLTMLRQHSRRARLEALLYDGTKPGTKELASVLNPSPGIHVQDQSSAVSPTDAAEILARAPELDEEEYSALLQYLQNTGHIFRHWSDLPHPQNAAILPPRASKPLQIHRGEHTFSCQKSHQGNSSIYFYNPLVDSHATGFIESIWQIPLQGTLRTFFIVRQHQPLSPQEEEQAPFINFPGFRARILDSQLTDELIIIELTHILTHITIYKRPPGTYGINRETIVVCSALDRGRRHS
ncbi:hypothetical protein CVT26_007466 [Gymnopilus dilepis]|uniref:Uncharacterized protein n=1 Tax=Gymnopilus dilepis TaxID=231916 RepID=A0A409W7X8_9AGAR|nr:hypothetical protein CVT26_007466 [Gymnopilus dilepis]